MQLRLSTTTPCVTLLTVESWSTTASTRSFVPQFLKGRRKAVSGVPGKISFPAGSPVAGSFSPLTSPVYAFTWNPRVVTALKHRQDRHIDPSGTHLAVRLHRYYGKCGRAVLTDVPDQPHSVHFELRAIVHDQPKVPSPHDIATRRVQAKQLAALRDGDQQFLQAELIAMQAGRCQR